MLEGSRTDKPHSDTKVVPLVAEEASRSVELSKFCDASEARYGAVVYL